MAPRNKNHFTPFLTPTIENTPVFLTILDSTNTHKKITCLKNIYSTSHLTEGINHEKNQKKTPAPPLNQNFCVCAHAKTSQFIVPSGNQAFKPLGQLFHNNNVIKFIFVKFFVLLVQQQSKMFLYENLGKQQNLFPKKCCHFFTLSLFFKRLSDCWLQKLNGF